MDLLHDLLFDGYFNGEKQLFQNKSDKIYQNQPERLTRD